MPHSGTLLVPCTDETEYDLLHLPPKAAVWRLPEPHAPARNSNGDLAIARQQTLGMVVSPAVLTPDIEPACQPSP